MNVSIDSIFQPADVQRSVSPFHVMSIVQEIKDKNGIEIPLDVIQSRGERYRLINGLHRLAAARWIREHESGTTLAEKLSSIPIRVVK
jgi:hypothetical protein